MANTSDYSVSEVAQLLGLTRQRVYQLINVGIIVPSVRLPKTRISEAELKRVQGLTRPAGRPWHKPGAQYHERNPTND